MSDKGDLISGLFLLLLGILMAVDSMRMSIYGFSGPREGFFPLFVSLMIILLSCWISVRGLLSIKSKDKRSQEKDPDKKSRLPRVFIYTIIMIAYSISFEKVGFLLLSSLFLVLTLRYMEKQSWKRTLGVGLGAVVMSYLLFVSFIGVPLPTGFFMR